MKYMTTRGGETASAERAIVQGLGADGGLFVPESFPQVTKYDLRDMAALNYNERAVRILERFLTGFSREQLRGMINAAYARFDDHGVAPLHELPGGVHVMELYHGPTLAFKDVALTLLPHLLTASARAVGESREVLILVATSGDTGKAALSGFADVPGTRCAVFYPNGGVSEAQRLQMVTQRGDNVAVMAVNGNFDDAQTGVKRIFSDREAAKAFAEKGVVLSSANSINWGRLVPQIVYYFSAYCDLLAKGTIAPEEKINICVPTGNFGNILAAYYAERMGLPVNRLICASNRNNVLADFIKTGRYDARREFYQTTSPSMDILISSNLERLLFELSGRDADAVSGWMKSLKETGEYEIGSDALDKLHGLMSGGWASDEDCAAEISRVWNENGYLIDPHTAVAMKVLRDYKAETGDEHVCVTASTASPFKFGRAVSAALHMPVDADDFTLCARLADKTGLHVPASIAELPTLPVRHNTVCAPEDMLKTLMAKLEK